jgi:plastocyanin
MRGWLVVVATAALAEAGCYDQPRPNCSFSCQTSQLCPEDYVCAPDGLCHLMLAGGGMAECPDLLVDGAISDAPIDGGNDAMVDATLEFDAAVPDAPPVDATLDPDAAVPDAAPIDAAVADAGPPDAAAPDASPPDASTSAVDLIACTGVTPDATIGTTGSAYVPTTTTITAGQIIKFIPTGTHDMVSGVPPTPDGTFQTPLATTACLRFNQVGTYPFFCSVHEFTGSVTVNP